MALGALDARTSNTSAASLVPWLVHLTLERTRQGLLWFSTAQTPGKSSAWTSTLERVNCCGPSTTCLIRVATLIQVHLAGTSLPLRSSSFLTSLTRAVWYCNHKSPCSIKQCKRNSVNAIQSYVLRHSIGFVLAFGQTVLTQALIVFVVFAFGLLI